MDIIRTNGNGKSEDSLIVCLTSLGVEARGTLIKLTRFIVVFEIYNPAIILRASEVLSDFRIIVNEHAIYSGHATVRHLMNMGQVLVCEATLNEDSWADVEFDPATVQNGNLRAKFDEFFQEWQKLYKILPEFKVVIADMQSFLADLKLWLDQVELNIRSAPSGNRIEMEKEIACQLEGQIVSTIQTLFEQFETISSRIEEDLCPAHRVFGKRQLHPLLLCSPFVYRTFHKPLGYAGDYESVNMMFRNPSEGGSLFAKMVNTYALQLPPIVAHRNRIAYLTEKLSEETWRKARQGGFIKVFNLGCGPAQEVQQFIAQHGFSEKAQFTLADFNDETLSFAATAMNDLKRRYTREVQVQYLKKSVQQIIKNADRDIQYSPSEQYDMIYCAGLFDYLSDKVCRKLTEIFYEMLAPKGVLIVTNVDAHPSQNEMEYFLDWYLIHRNNEQMRALTPRKVTEDNVTLKRDPTGVNIFLEIRKLNE